MFKTNYDGSFKTFKAKFTKKGLSGFKVSLYNTHVKYVFLFSKRMRLSQKLQWQNPI